MSNVSIFLFFIKELTDYHIKSATFIMIIIFTNPIFFGSVGI
jgi:hypothetical protein